MPVARTRPKLAGLLLSAALALSVLPVLPATPAQAATPASATESASADWGSPGPYEVRVDIEAVHTFYYPADLAASGTRHPVVIWGNGTGAVPGVYSGLLRHLASQGFIVAAANTPTSNFAITMRAGIDVLERRDADPGSRFHGKVDLDHIGAAGHSQGGAAALNAAVDDRVDTAVPIQPGPLASADAMDEPVFYLAGQYDLTVPPVLVKAFYADSDHVPAVYGEVRGAGHLGSIGDGGDFRAPVTAWLRYQLMGDAEARAEFTGPGCGYCGDTELWSDWRRNAKAQAL
ncbi:alpha/beta hydrolase family protein [Streptomyces sp. NPDC050418]|uniref:alpha/beta hydrolase family protein n=1 Tax=Streptomyces sp. NPDC050418 TaxID=3365612 RepID=UPI0037B912BA